MIQSTRVGNLLCDDSGSGPHNMAVDQAILQDVADGDARIWLRFYRWTNPTLSLGYFQAYGDAQDALVGEPAEIVRRATGGGAILHDREITYSLTLPTTHPLATSPVELYLAVHGSLIRALAQFGCKAELFADGERLENGPFLCFDRRAEQDVVLVGPNPMKICGSAQRRRRGACLIHGSLLLQASPLAPQLLGVCDFHPTMDEQQLQIVWFEQLRRVLDVGHWRPSELTPRVARSAREITKGKYERSDWTHRR